MRFGGLDLGKASHLQVNKLSQIKRLSPKAPNSGERHPLDTYIICEYVSRPLLIGGRKFDMRVYVVVASYRPLVAYIAREGFARFCNVKYSNEVAELRNSEMHLTNVAVQKVGEQYNSFHGNKWPMSAIFNHLEATRRVNSSPLLASHRCQQSPAQGGASIKQASLHLSALVALSVVALGMARCN